MLSVLAGQDDGESSESADSDGSEGSDEDEEDAEADAEEAELASTSDAPAKTGSIITGQAAVPPVEIQAGAPAPAQDPAEAAEPTDAPAVLPNGVSTDKAVAAPIVAKQVCVVCSELQ